MEPRPTPEQHAADLEAQYQAAMAKYSGNMAAYYLLTGAFHKHYDSRQGGWFSPNQINYYEDGLKLTVFDKKSSEFRIPDPNTGNYTQVIAADQLAARAVEQSGGQPAPTYDPSVYNEEVALWISNPKHRGKPFPYPYPPKS